MASDKSGQKTNCRGLSSLCTSNIKNETTIIKEDSTLKTMNIHNCFTTIDKSEEKNNGKKMIKISEVKEAVIITKSLEIMLQKLISEETLYTDKTLYIQTIQAVNSIRIKYNKIALTQMRKNDKGKFEFKNAN
jgi:hypothetical protein